MTPLVLDIDEHEADMTHFLESFPYNAYFTEIWPMMKTSHSFYDIDNEPHFKDSCTTICAYNCHILYLYGWKEVENNLRLSTTAGVTGYQALLALFLHNLSCENRPHRATVDGYSIDYCLEPEQVNEYQTMAVDLLREQEYDRLDTAVSEDRIMNRRYRTLPSSEKYGYPVTTTLLKIQNVLP